MASQKLETLDSKLTDRRQPIASQQVRIEDYVAAFTERYSQEEPFREMVHQYLQLHWYQKAGLKIRKLRKSWYRHQVDNIIGIYAQRVQKDLEEARGISQELGELERAEKELREQAVLVQEKAGERTTSEQQYKNTQEQHQAELRKIEVEASQKKYEEEQQKIAAQREIQRQLDAKAYAAQVVQQQLKQSAYISLQDDGTLAFDEEKLSHRLEEIFLQETVQGIEAEDGCSGFISKVRESYEGIISHHTQIRSLSQLRHVDWTKSTIYSRRRGYLVPTYPYLLAGVSEAVTKATIDTAISIDNSASMAGNQRFTVATKTGMSLRALMRQLHPQNKTFLSTYSSEVNELSSADLLRSAATGGSTRTDLALDWLLEKLQGFGIAYLLTDGAPNSLQDTIESAKKYQQSPGVQLRIFLIDGNGETKENIRQIGKAAGTQSKVIPVENYQLAGGALRDIADVLRDMYDVGKF